MKAKFNDLGLESIDFKIDTNYFDTLAVLFGRLKGVQHPAEVRNLYREIEKLTFDATGIKVKLELVRNGVVNAQASIPPLSKDHVFYDSARRMRLANVKSKWLVEKNMNGAIDQAAGKVSGDFSKIEYQIMLFDGLFSVALDGAEIAAVYLHELGHCFTHLAMLAQVWVTNVVLNEVAMTFSGTNDRKQRIKVLAEVEEATGHKFEDKAALADTPEPGSAMAIVMVACITRCRSALGTSFYDKRLCEFMADQFAARHGAARASITFAAKVEKSLPASRRIDGYKETSSLVVTNLISVMMAMVKVSISNGPRIGIATPAGFVTSLVMGVGVHMLLALFKGTDDRYDEFLPRQQALRREIVASLKNRNVPTQYRDRVLEDLDIADATLAEVHNFGKVTKMAGEALAQYFTGRYKELKFQRQYEQLANNDLFAASARLNQLA